MGELPHWTSEQAKRAAEAVLGRALDGNDSTVCPGDELHTTSKGKTDFRVFLTGKVPYGHCFHSHCYERVMEFNKALWRRLFGGYRHGVDMAFQESGMKRVKEVIKKRQDFDKGALQSEQTKGLAVDKTWLRERSPVDPAGVSPADFLDALYEPGERVLCFTAQYSQGDYGYVVGEKAETLKTETLKSESQWCELGMDKRHPNVRLETRETPRDMRAAKEGVWFLCQPVDGKWHLDGRLKDKVTGLPKWSRRSEVAVTDWRYMVLESDEAPVDMWLNFIVQLKLRVAALYTSGGRSVHALVRVNATSKPQWDAMRDMMQPVLSKLGADPGAMSAVRLTRLPGCIRKGKVRSELWRNPDTGEEEKRVVYHRFEKGLLQELLYLNPSPAAVEILHMPRVRIEGGTNGPA